VLEQLSTHFFPWHGRGRIGIVSLDAPLNLLALSNGELYTLRAVLCNTVPDVLDELDSLSQREFSKVDDALGHALIIPLASQD
jgi:hypothetical protein